MSPELIGILTVGVAVIAVMLTALQRIDRRFERVEERIDTLEERIDKRFERIEERVDTLEERMNKRIDGVEDRIASLEKGQARLEGLLDGLREALFERAARSA